MPSQFSYKNDSDEDQRASPEETARRLQEQEQQSGFNRDFNDLTSPDHLAKNGKEGDLGEEEAKGSWDTDVGNNSQIDKPRLAKFIGFAKKRGATVGLISILGLGGIGAAGFLGPSSMIMSVMENFVKSNDTSSTSLERRFMNVFGNMTGGDPICANSSKMKCKLGKISNKALNQLANKNVVAYNGSTPVDTSSRKGYPSSNPTRYQIDLGDGSAPKMIDAKDLPGFLAQKENAKIAAKILGTKGAFNLKVKAWSGKYITKKLFKKFDMNKKGGLAAREEGGAKSGTALERLRKKIPGLDKLSGISDTVKGKVGKNLGSAKKGGAAYTVAVASCIAIKAPGYIAAGVAAVQIAQVLPIVMETVLSPGSMAMASGVDPAAKEFSGEAMNEIGTVFTEKTPNSDGSGSGSALDSPYLLAAMGVNTSKLAVSKDYTPGYSILTDPLVIASVKADKTMAPVCNALMSPAAMYTAMAVSAAITVALAPTVVGALGKIILEAAATEVVGEVVKEVAGEQAVGAVVNLAQNDLIPKARGRALGDLVGVSASTFFPAGAMARNLPALTMNQVPTFAAAQQESENFHRDMDIASLSPFDTSSRYTFMGSIVYNMRMAALTGGAYENSFTSFLSTMAKLPLQGLSMLSKSASAEGYSTNSCGYAADFGLEAADPAQTPAINMAGLPCTGLTSSMSTSTAIDLVEKEGWLDNSKTIKDGATIDDLVSSGYIIADTPLANYIASCGDASSGDYLFNTASCTVDSTPGDLNSATEKLKESGATGECADEDNDDCLANDTTTAATLKSGDSMTAMAVILADFQVGQMINGEDDIKGEEMAFVIPDDDSTDAVIASEGDSTDTSESETTYIEARPVTTFDSVTVAKNPITAQIPLRDWLMTYGASKNSEQWFNNKLIATIG